MNPLRKTNDSNPRTRVPWTLGLLFLLFASVCTVSAQLCVPIRVTQYSPSWSHNLCDTNCVTLSVGAYGTRPEYQWYFESRALAGETGSTLTLCHVDSHDAGTYSVAITNPCSQTNLAMTLSVYTNTQGPSITCPPTQTVRTCTSNGTVVVFEAPVAYDDHGTPLPVTCAPAAGSVFPLGTTSVRCGTEDACGNRAICSFDVQVLYDYTPPSIQCPDNMMVWTCSSNGAVVEYPQPLTWDDYETNLTVICKPFSGSSFPLGTTTVNCLVFDQCGRSSECQFLVTVQMDATPPVLTCPGDFVVGACDPKGVQVFYPNLSAVDNASPSVSISCSPANGSFLPVGQTAVRCTATDDCGHRSSCGFTVSVVLETNVLKPQVTGMVPSLLSTLGGTALEVDGVNFGVSDQVLLNGLPLVTHQWINSHKILGQTPPLAPGPITLTIERCGTQMARVLEAGEAALPPRLVSIEPAKVFARGGRVEFRGENLRAETLFMVALPGVTGGSNLVRHLVVAADGFSASGDVPALPAGALYGPRAVVVEDTRGRCVLEAGLSYIPNPVERNPQVLSLRQLEQTSMTKPQVLFQRGFPTVVKAEVPVTGATSEQRARQFLRSYAPLFRNLDADNHLRVKRVITLPQEAVHFAQQFNAVPIYGAGLTVLLQSNQVLLTSGKVTPPGSLAGLNLTPSVTSGGAEALAHARFGVTPRPTLRPTELLILDLGLLGFEGTAPKLAWLVTLGTGLHKEVFLDAQTGEVLLSLNMERPDFDLDLVDAEDEANAEDDACYNLSDDTDVANEDWFNDDYLSDPDAVWANAYARQTWYFYWNHFGRDSYDNDGSQMEVFIHATVCDKLASWSPSCELISICSGWVDYEVITHEFTHGVIQYGSDLVYTMQPGALNEHYADIMSLIADWEAGDTNWTVGENSTGNAPNYIRNLSWPHTVSTYDPGIPNADGEYPDNGNVHDNSEIPSYAAYLMTMGGTNLGLPFSGIGIDKLRELKYAALTCQPLNTDFAMAAEWESDVAWAWAQTGTHGFTKCDARAVRTAWAQVGLGWPDMNCDGQPDGYPYFDMDGDHLYDFIDNCPYTANPDQADLDHDGVGDVCDNCKYQSNPDQADMDEDGKGDLCDPDIDGDGCLNEVDQHPNASEVPMGSYFGPCCENGTIYGFEGDDTDHDGLLNCEDDDDDNDGIPDEQDGCPMGTFGQFGQWGGCTEVVGTCGCAPLNWQAVCLGGGCQMFFLKIVDAMNPDPSRDVVFDRFQIVNQTLFFSLGAGNTPAQTAEAMGFNAVAQKDLTPSLRRIEIWARATPNTAAMLVAIVGEYDPDSTEWQPLSLGNILAVKPPARSGEPFRIGATWFVGGDPQLADLDSDKDGIPDGWERRYQLNPFSAVDAAADWDGDGASNRDEFRAGTNPLDPESCFRVTRTEWLGQAVRIEFNTELGRKYQLERSLNLGSNRWTLVGPTGTVALTAVGTGGPMTLTDDEPQGQAGFYRVISSSL